MTDASDTLAFPLLTHLDGLMDDLRTRVPAALNDWEPEAIHQSRVATRRLKAALDLMKVVLSKRHRRSFEKATRKLRRRLGPLRDVDVMLEHVASVGEDGKWGLAVGWLSQRLACERAKARKKSAKKGAPVDAVGQLAAWDDVRAEIVAARDAVDSLLAETLHLQLDVFAEQADRLAAEAGLQGAEPVPPPDDEEDRKEHGTGEGRQDPHELRISGKALRYTLEMAAVEGHELPASLTKSFKKMQESLGLWHDYVVLVEYATRAALDELLAHHEPRLMTEVLDLACDVLGRATRHLEKFKNLWAEVGDTTAKAIRSAFPLTRPYTRAAGAGADAGEGVTEPKTGRSPSDSESPAAPEDAPPTSASDA